MRYPESVTLESVVLHSLDARENGSGFRPSKALLPFASDPELSGYISTHIRQSLKHTSAKAAKFSNRDEVEAFQVCDAMHEDRVSLLEGTTTLARKLYDIMCEDGRIAPGVLAFCFYRDSEEETADRRIALLKIDLGKVFRTKMLQDDEGNEIISLELDQDALTTTRERLHKSAFVRKLSPRAADYDMILLDRQSRSGRDQEGEMVPTIAKFFIEDFLGAEEALDPKERTRKFHKAVMAAVNTLKDREDFAADQEGVIVRSMENALNSARVNIEDWADALPLPPEQKDTLWEIVVREQPDMEFEPDAQYVRRALQKARYIGSSGLTVTVNAAQAPSIVIEEQKVEDGLQKYWLITIRTERWDKTS